MLGSWPVAVPAFRLLMVGQLTSTLGDYFFAVALPWYVLSRGGGPTLLGWVLAGYGASDPGTMRGALVANVERPIGDFRLVTASTIAGARTFASGALSDDACLILARRR